MTQDAVTLVSTCTVFREARCADFRRKFRHILSVSLENRPKVTQMR